MSPPNAPRWQALRRANETLEARVMERTLELEDALSQCRARQCQPVALCCRRQP